MSEFLPNVVGRSHLAGHDSVPGYSVYRSNDQICISVNVPPRNESIRFELSVPLTLWERFLILLGLSPRLDITIHGPTHHGKGTVVLRSCGTR